jgi:hypothetical protein
VGVVGAGVHQAAVGDLEDGAEPVGVGLVGAEEAEVVRVGGVEVAQQQAEAFGRFGTLVARLPDLDRVGRGVGDLQRQQAATAVGVRRRAHPQVPLRRQRGQLRDQAPLLVKALIRPVAAHPPLQHRQVLGVLADAFQRHLVRAEGALDRDPVDLGRAGPALRGAEDDRRPARPPCHRLRAPRLRLDPGDPLARRGQHRGELAVDLPRVVSRDEVAFVAVAGEQVGDLALARPPQHRRAGNFVLVQVQDRQHRSVARRVEEAHALP